MCCQIPNEELLHDRVRWRAARVHGEIEMIIELERDMWNTLFVFPRAYGLEELRAAAQVRHGSYADELVERIYRCIFVYPVDLRAEYAQYYAVEYSTFSEFLYWRYRVDRPKALELESDICGAGYIGYGWDRTSMLSDETVATMLDNMMSILH